MTRAKNIANSRLVESASAMIAPLAIDARALRMSVSAITASRKTICTL